MSLFSRPKFAGKTREWSFKKGKNSSLRNFAQFLSVTAISDRLSELSDSISAIKSVILHTFSPSPSLSGDDTLAGICAYYFVQSITYFLDSMKPREQIDKNVFDWEVLYYALAMIFLAAVLLEGVPVAEERIS